MILETEFEEIQKEVILLYDSNEEMEKLDPTDYDLVEARQENLEIINNKKILRMKDLQEELRKYCPTNPLVTKNVFDYFSEHDTNKNKKSEVTGNIKSEEIIQEIDL